MIDVRRKMSYNNKNHYPERRTLMKLISFILAAALALVLCSCAGSSESSSYVTLYQTATTTTANEPEQAAEPDPDVGISLREGESFDGAVIAYGYDITAEEAKQVMDSTLGTVSWVVILHLSDAGSANYAEASNRLAGNGSITVWYNKESIFSAEVAAAAGSDGIVMITGNFTEDSAKELTDKLNGVS